MQTIVLSTTAELAKNILGTLDTARIEEAATQLGLQPYQVVNRIRHWDEDAAEKLRRHFTTRTKTRRTRH